MRADARAWLRVIWRAWFDRKPYDAELHLSSSRAPIYRGDNQSDAEGALPARGWRRC